MKKKRELGEQRVWSCLGVLSILILWQLAVSMRWIEKFLLPGPYDVWKAFWQELPILKAHMAVTLTEAMLGLLLGTVLGFFMAVGMDTWKPLYKICYPLMIISQTIPTVAIAPLLVLWFGYEMTPKIILIVITTFFPITMGLFQGFQSADPDEIHLLQAMGAGRRQIFRYLKLPQAMDSFFSGLRISASYSVVGAVIAEWLGGFQGLGVYMTRVKKAFSFDKMFAVIILITLISLLLMKGVDILEKICMPWKKGEKNET